MFNGHHIDLSMLRKHSFNLRWAEVEAGVIPLTAADPDFPVAMAIREAVSSFAMNGHFHYGPAKGMLAFREAVSNYFHYERSVSVSPAHILPTDSAASAIHLICKSFLTTGDEAIVFDPVDFLFAYSVDAAGAIPVRMPLPGHAPIDIELLESRITDRTRMICLCNPMNPTGKVFTREELTQLGELAIRHDLLILSDEIWSDIVYEPHCFVSIASISNDIANRTITVTGFSKSYGLAGLRIGALGTASASLFNTIETASAYAFTVQGVDILAQVAATAALTQCKSWLQEFVQHLHQVRDLAVRRINQIEGFSCVAPQGTYLAWVDIRKTGLTAEQVQQQLLEQARVSVVPGSARWFGPGAAGHIRISFATTESLLNESFARIEHTIIPAGNR